MLNELWEIGTALAGAGIPVSLRHPDVKEAGTRPALLVRLDAAGSVSRVSPLSADEAAQLWTIRDGQKNSFPYYQLKRPLLRVSPEDERLELVRNKKAEEAERWAALLRIVESAETNGEAFTDLLRTGYLARIRERREQLGCLSATVAAAVPATFERFLLAANRPTELLHGILGAVVEGVRRGRITSEYQLIAGLLVDSGGALYFDVDRDFGRSAADVRNVPEISRALDGEMSRASSGVCAVTGETGPLLSDKFPQPKLPVLGQTYLFARNPDAPTAARYRRSGTGTMAIGAQAASVLQGAAEAITRPEWKNLTWRSIPGERSKQLDLFVAFVPGNEDIALAAMLSALDAEPVPGTEQQFTSLAEKLTRAFKGRVKDTRETRLSLLVLRSVDPANRKAVYSSSPTVEELLGAARRWSRGCENVPPSIQLLIPAGRGEPARFAAPRPVAPLSITPLTRRLFIRGGTQVQEVVGVGHNEAMRLFLAPDDIASAHARAVLRRVLRGRGSLLSGVGHARTRGFDDLKAYDRSEALDTVTLLSLLLYLRGRTREDYMEDAAYTLGQVLAGADLLHAAYNASERGGDMLPPRLIGNAVLPMAQSKPHQALAVLARRWAVYEGWARRKGSRWSFPDQFRGKRRRDIDRKVLAEYDRAQTIARGLFASRRLGELAAELKPALRDAEVNDEFRAELLLGYIAGVPRADETSAAGDTDHPQQEGDE